MSLGRQPAAVAVAQQRRRGHASASAWRLLVCLGWLSACTLERAPSGSDQASGGNGAGVSGTSAGGGAGAGSGSGGGGASGAGGSASTSDAAVSADAASVNDAAAASDAGPQGYEPGAVGAPCSDDHDCQLDRESRTCFSESYFAPLLTLPKGYCGKLCDLTAATPCELGAVCVTIPTFPPIPACFRGCTSDADCRVQDGYSCNKPFTSTESVCSLRN